MRVNQIDLKDLRVLDYSTFSEFLLQEGADELLEDVLGEWARLEPIMQMSLSDLAGLLDAPLARLGVYGNSFKGLTSLQSS